MDRRIVLIGTIQVYIELFIILTILKIVFQWTMQSFMLHHMTFLSTCIPRFIQFGTALRRIQKQKDKNRTHLNRNLKFDQIIVKRNQNQKIHVPRKTISNKTILLRTYAITKTSEYIMQMVTNACILFQNFRQFIMGKSCKTKTII